MKIESVKHKGLRRFMDSDDASGLPAASVVKIRDILTFLLGMSAEDDVRQIPSWRSHQLTGSRRGTWALHVTRNWRITFRINPAGMAIVDLDFEDYH